MPRRTKEEALKTKKKIMMSALDMFCEKGYTHSSLEDIADRIGLTKGAVYWHFKNKQDLLFSLAEELNIRGTKILAPQLRKLKTSR